MKVKREPVAFKTFDVDCKECGALLEVEHDDIDYYYCSDQRDGTDEYFFITCPRCRTQHRVANINVPPMLQLSLKKSKRGY